MTTTRIENCPICNDNHLIHRLSYTDSVSNQTFEILQCSSCGLLMTQHAPKLSDMETYYPTKDSAYYKRTQSKWDKWLEHLTNRWNKEQVQIVCEESERKSGVLLEMGSKKGYFANAIRNNGWLAHAVENDNTAREYGNDRFLLHAEKAELLFDINPRSYNVVVAWDTLGESANLHDTLDKLSQLIVSDGTLIIAFHDAACEEAMHYGSAWHGWDAPRKRWHLTPKAFEQLLQQHNLTIVNRRCSALRSFITTLVSKETKEPSKNFFTSAVNTVLNAMSNKKYSYYIYTLKHQEESK